MKKAQIRIFEVVAVVIIFFMLLALGIIYFSSLNKGSVEQETEKTLELRALGIAEQVQALPELQCSTNNIIMEKCFDELKLNAIKKIKPDYFSSFGYSEVYISNPGDDNYEDDALGIYINPKPDYKEKVTINLPITVTISYQTPVIFGADITSGFVYVPYFQILTVNVYD